MPKGGSRPGAGRPAKENSRAKDRAAAAAKAATAKVPAAAKASVPSRVIDDGEWLTLAREGRTANPPAWPLTVASTRERALWRSLWKRPVALAWELVGAEHQVATYVRTLVRMEETGSAIGLTNQARLLQHELGLTGGGLRALKWRIARPSQVHAQTTAPVVPQGPSRSGMSPKERMGFRVVSGGG